MDTVRCKRIVEKHFSKIVAELHLTDWSISVDYLKLENKESAAYCHADIDYKKALLELDPERHTSDQDVVDTLYHELAHVILASFNLYRDVVNPKPSEAEERLWTFVLETVTTHLEKVLVNR
jgi:hypothetical protein